MATPAMFFRSFVRSFLPSLSFLFIHGPAHGSQQKRNSTESFLVSGQLMPVGFKGAADFLAVYSLADQYGTSVSKTLQNTGLYKNMACLQVNSQVPC